MTSGLDTEAFCYAQMVQIVNKFEQEISKQLKAI
jgi:hypothetical protein